MKKLLMGFAVCALTLTSCNNNEVMENLDTSNGQLTFLPAVGKQTHAAEIMNTTLQAEATNSKPIKLYAYQADGTGAYEKWFNDDLSYNTTDSKWEITSTRFRNTSATKYLAYWPATNVTPDINAGLFSGEFDYEVQSPANQEDLIAGITDLEANKTDVVFKMRHILSQVNFGVKAYKGAQITISKITVKNIDNTGTYTFYQEDDGTTGGGDIIGKWSDNVAIDQNQEYSLPTITAVPIAAADVKNIKTGDKYIFGDGGNAGPGRGTDTFYPIGTNGAWTNAHATNSTSMNNSLMLLPQELTGAVVEFEYTIQDIDGAYVAGTATTPATGSFALDFITGTTSGTNYLNKWEQNFRYIYIIDFTDFLNDNALTFKVDVEAFPWGNYNVNGDNNGEVQIPVIGQPTQTVINTLSADGTYYMASRSTTAPTETQKVQVVKDVSWDWTLYDFTTIKSTSGNKIMISFQNVIFNGKEITLILPTGFTATQNGVALTNNKITSDTYPVIITNTK